MKADKWRLYIKYDFSNIEKLLEYIYSVNVFIIECDARKYV